MTLASDEFIRRFLLHLLPPGFHRIRHYGLLSASARTANLGRASLLKTDALLGMESGFGQQQRPPSVTSDGRNSGR